MLLSLLLIIIVSGKTRRLASYTREASLHPSLVQFVTQIDFKANTIVGSVINVANRSLLVELFLNQRHGGLDNVVHKAFHRERLGR